MDPVGRSVPSRDECARVLVASGALAAGGMWVGVAWIGGWAGVLVGIALTLLAGTWVWVQIVRPLSAVHGTVLEMEARARELGAGPREDSVDLARRSTREAAASRQEADRLRRVVEAMEEPVLAIGPFETVLAHNEAARALVGARASLIGRPIQDLFTSADVLRLHDQAQGGEGAGARLRMSSGIGARMYEVRAVPLRRTGEVDGVVMSFSDVTELAAAAALKTDFVANASHELRTPLSAIRGAVETLSEVGDDESMRDRLVRMIAENVRRLEDMVNDLLDLSRLESSESPVRLARCEVEPLLREVAQMFEGVCSERRLAIDVRVLPGAHFARTDPRLLELIVRNLIENATKFAYEGTTIRVSAEAVASGGALRDLRVRVADRGVGIPLDQQQRIFERFYQVDPARTGLGNARRGTGLGLAIVKHAARLLGGGVMVESVWKQGTTMTVDIPASAEPDPEGGRNAV
ncbi:MAG: ATP-binding protein [Phycisphaerales bacterium]|nr:ATP-binding protein [Phycisphaerales bacterium]